MCGKFRLVSFTMFNGIKNYCTLNIMRSLSKVEVFY